MRIRTTFLGAGLSVATSVLLAAPALAADTPPATGCPASNQVLDVAQLTALGYRVPAQLDAAGNRNGLVCGKPLADPAAENVCRKLGGCVVETIYLFRDDDLTR